MGNRGGFGIFVGSILCASCSDDATSSGATPIVQRGTGGHDAGARSKLASGGRSTGGGGQAGSSIPDGGHPVRIDGSAQTDGSVLRDASQHADSSAPADAGDGGVTREGSVRPDAGPDDGSPSGASCVDVKGTGTPWPPMPTVFARPECVPNCDMGQCGSKCASGAPCDSGCCANQIAGGTSATGDPAARSQRAVYARDSSGTMYTVTPDSTSVHYSEVPTTGASDHVYALDCAEQDPQWAYCPGLYPQVAVGGPPGAHTVYVVYNRGSDFNPAYRFGTKIGKQWTFEDLSMAGRLAADPSGNAWLSSEGKLYRHDSAKGWVAVPVPCGESIRSIAFDDSGSLYAGGSDNRMWRRAPVGSWGFETTPGPFERVYTGAGTVHYTAAPRTVRTDSGYVWTNFRYGRRIGTTWSEEKPLGDGVEWTNAGFDMALDTCGAPHFAFSVFRYENPLHFWDLSYVRWTAAGWRSIFVYTSQDPQDPGIGVSTASAMMTFFAGSPDVATATIPLR